MKKTHYTAPQTRVEEAGTACMLASSSIEVNTGGDALDYHETLVRDGGFWD